MKITSEKLFDIVKSRCLKKIRANSYKPSPLLEGFDYLKKRAIEEDFEAVVALREHIENPSADTLDAFLDEIADTINFYAFMGAKAAGFTVLKR